ncbi:hypothetical protein PInf_023599 [Phytophthora infestans]|nr:hypothetical protein PInf_023599 [Phytophthora infestans]
MFNSSPKNFQQKILDLHNSIMMEMNRSLGESGASGNYLMKYVPGTFLLELLSVGINLDAVLQMIPNNATKRVGPNHDNIDQVFADLMKLLMESDGPLSATEMAYVKSEIKENYDLLGIVAPTTESAYDEFCTLLHLAAVGPAHDMELVEWMIQLGAFIKRLMKTPMTKRDPSTFRELVQMYSKARVVMGLGQTSGLDADVADSYETQVALDGMVGRSLFCECKLAPNTAAQHRSALHRVAGVIPSFYSNLNAFAFMGKGDKCALYGGDSEDDVAKARMVLYAAFNMIGLEFDMESLQPLSMLEALRFHLMGLFELLEVNLRMTHQL